MNARTAIVALMVDAEGDVTAVRFADYRELQDWEDAHPQVSVQNTARLVTRAQALAGPGRSE